LNLIEKGHTEGAEQQEEKKKTQGEVLWIRKVVSNSRKEDRSALRFHQKSPIRPSRSEKALST